MDAIRGVGTIIIRESDMKHAKDAVAKNPGRRGSSHAAAKLASPVESLSVGVPSIGEEVKVICCFMAGEPSKASTVMPCMRTRTG